MTHRPQPVESPPLPPCPPPPLQLYVPLGLLEVAVVAVAVVPVPPHDKAVLADPDPTRRPGSPPVPAVDPPQHPGLLAGPRPASPG